MRAPLLTCLTILFGLATSCSPATKCGGALYYDSDNFSCRPCPQGARFEDGTCACPDGAEFKDHRCVGGIPPDVDAAVPAGCEAYCDFVNVCLAENDTALSVIPGVIDSLQNGCASSCAAVGGDGELASCIEEGREAAACAGNEELNGMMSAITLFAECSRAHADDPLRPVICAGLKQSSLVASRIDFCD